MGFFMPDPDPRAGYFDSVDLSGLNDPQLRGPMPFGIPLAALRSAFPAFRPMRRLVAGINEPSQGPDDGASSPSGGPASDPSDGSLSSGPAADPSTGTGLGPERGSRDAPWLYLDPAARRALRDQCTEVCHPFLNLPRNQDPTTTYERCLAHCEGRIEWPQFAPAIPYGGWK